MIFNRISQVGIALTFIVAFMILSSCEDDTKDGDYKDFNNTPGGPGLSMKESSKKAKNKGEDLAGKKADEKSNRLTVPQLNEMAFISGPKHRDPFLPFLEVLVKREKITDVVQREVKLKEYDISELKLIGIITNIDDPRAMVTTPDKTGFVIRRGDYVGRADYVKQGNQEEPIQVNWRVARIHGTGKEEERGVYLVRDDPTTSRGVDVTRFIPLHPVE